MREGEGAWQGMINVKEERVMETYPVKICYMQQDFMFFYRDGRKGRERER